MLSRNLGVSLTAVTSVIAVNQATAVIGILFGPLADRMGYRFMMLSGLVCLVSGMLWTGFWPSYGALMFSLFLAGLGKTLFDPAIQAYIGRQVPYGRRGTAIGLLEMSWAGSTLVGIPGIALLMNWLGWKSPFFVMGALGLVGMAGIRMLNSSSSADTKSTFKHNPFGPAWRKLFRNRPAVAALAYAFFISVANDNLFVVYGAWFENAFGISVVLLGLGTGVIGVAELLGEGITASFADRFGLLRSIKAGLIFTVLSYLLLPVIGTSLWSALLGIFAVFMAFEFTIVTSISLCTELLPAYRATMMSAFFASAGVGRVVGALIGSTIWLKGGMGCTCLVSAGMTLLALISLAAGGIDRDAL